MLLAKLVLIVQSLSVLLEMNKMTVEQKKMVEDNHKLIYGLLARHNLDADEYYDIAAIGLCKAAIYYKDDISAFSTYAYYVMYNEIKQEYRRRSKACAIPVGLITSYNDTFGLPNQKEISFIDTFVSEETVEERVVVSMSISNFISKLSERDLQILSMRYHGCTQREIAEKVHLSQSYVARVINKLKDLYGGD